MKVRSAYPQDSSQICSMIGLFGMGLRNLNVDFLGNEPDRPDSIGKEIGWVIEDENAKIVGVAI